MRRALALVLIITLPSVAGAQFTTFIPPRAPPPKAEATKTVAAARKKEAAKAERDTLYRIRLTPMRIWVDSASGLRSTLPDTTRDGFLGEVTWGRRTTVALESWPNQSAFSPQSLARWTMASPSSRSRALSSLRDFRFRRIGTPPSEWWARSNARQLLPESRPSFAAFRPSDWNLTS